MKSISSWETREGSAYPLGVNYIEEEQSYNFAIYSRHATNVTLLIYSGDNLEIPLFKYDFDYRINKSNRIWHCRVKAAQIRNARYYAYKVDGPEPAGGYEWHSFDKDKILLDPYARGVFFPSDFNKLAASCPGPNDGKAPLGVILQNRDFDWQEDKFVRHEQDLIIYELHVKGFSFHPSSEVSESNRGTFNGLVDKIPYLKEIGITAVELMPVHQFLVNGEYWGYNSLNFFSPHSGYFSGEDTELGIAEFKMMVRELHKAHIEVILDVVFNHTAEGDQDGPVLSYRGIDNSTYYLISDNPANPYYNYSGTGNTMHTRNNSVRRLILDSLHYWRNEMHVDGFRFDLASVFNRNADGSISFEEPAVLGMIASDPDLAGARFIAEPWDATGANYLGKKFPGVTWMQWNSAFRDDVRRFVKSDLGMNKSLRDRIYGSNDIFPDDLINAFHAFQSINYVVSHDGFTLYDLVSYNEKHNYANGENNKDGSDQNFSWNCGAEGDDHLTEEMLTFRKRQARNFCTLLFLANGTPMIVAGDEFLRTQQGNNNPYNQDNELNWIDWTFKDKNNDVFVFFKKMIQFRKSHPSLCRSRFWQSDVQWFSLSRQADSAGLPLLAFYLNGSSEGDDDIYVMVNAHWEAHSFTFQQQGPWYRVINTALGFPNDFIDEGIEKVTNVYLVAERSIAVFVKKNLS